MVLTIGWTLAQTPYTAWGAEIAPDYSSRTSVTAWREGLGLLGTLIATLVYFGAGQGGQGLGALAMIIIALLPVSILIAVLVTSEDRQPPKSSLSIAEGWQAMRGNAPFRRLLLSWFINGAANGVPVTLFLFFVADVLQGDSAVFETVGIEVAGVCLLAYFLAAILGMPGWSWLADRIGKHRAWCFAMIWACLIFAWALTLEAGAFQSFLVISILTGLAFGADLALPPAMQADVIELDTRQTGAGRAGLFFAIWQVATKASVALSSGLALIVLGWSGFTAGGENSDQALQTLVILYAGVPILLKLVAVALIWSFPLDRRSVEHGL